MTVVNNLNKHTYVGNGVTTQWAYTFKIFRTTDIQVVLTEIATGIDTVITSNYSVDPVNNVVTYPSAGSPLPSAYKITLNRKVPLTQETSLPNNGPYFATVHEVAFDKGVIIAQQQQEQLSRSLVHSVSVDSDVSNELPAPVPLHSFRWNNTGDALETTLDPAIVVESANAERLGAEIAREGAETALSDVNSIILAAVSTATNTATIQAEISTTKATEATTQAVISTAQAVIASAQAVTAATSSTNAASSAAAANLAAQSHTDTAKTTLALLNADLAWVANKTALVTNDPTSTNNGIYIKTGVSGAGSWQKSAYIPPTSEVDVTKIINTVQSSAPLKILPTYAITPTVSSLFSAAWGANKANDGSFNVSANTEGWLSGTAANGIGAWLNLHFARNYGKTIVCIGDSITDGINQHSQYDPALLGAADNPMGCYPYQLKQMIPDWNVVNKGIHGNTTTQMVSRFIADVISFNPSFVIIQGGINDLNDAVPISTIESNISGMVYAAIEAGILPILTTILPWRTGTTQMKTDILAINAWMRSYAKVNRLPLIDWYPLFDDPANPTNPIDGLTGDGLHPLTVGYMMMAEAIDTKIFNQHRHLRGLNIGNIVATGANSPGTYGLPLTVEISYGGKVQQATLYNYDSTGGITTVMLSNQAVETNDVKVTIKTTNGGTYSGFGDVQLLF